MLLPKHDLFVAPICTALLQHIIPKVLWTPLLLHANARTSLTLSKNFLLRAEPGSLVRRHGAFHGGRKRDGWFTRRFVLAVAVRLICRLFSPSPPGVRSPSPHPQKVRGSDLVLDLHSRRSVVNTARTRRKTYLRMYSNYTHVTFIYSGFYARVCVCVCVYTFCSKLFVPNSLAKF